MLWHSRLAMPKYNLDWHEQDMADELKELNEADGLVHTWSEYSDVAYTYSRGKWSGHDISLPIAKTKYYLGLVYMYPKYSLRYTFYRSAGKSANSKIKLKEVRNPKKIHKLHTIADKYSIDKEQFQKTCEKQLKYWPLLP